MANWNKNDVFRLLNLNSVLIFAFFLWKDKASGSYKMVPYGFHEPCGKS